MVQVSCENICCFPELRDPKPYPAVNYWCNKCRPYEEMPLVWRMRKGWIAYEKVRHSVFPKHALYRPILTKTKLKHIHTLRDIPRPIQIRRCRTCRVTSKQFYYHNQDQPGFGKV